MRRFRHDALLILGPTGAGKTPLGDELELRGVAGRRCAHLDFGQRLRSAAETTRRPEGLSNEDVETIRRKLLSGALLTDQEFPIALSIVREFLLECQVGLDDVVILNGLPRHPGQATALEPLIRVLAVVVLEASDDTLEERIQRNTGGDRLGRDDDTLDQVKDRLRLYRTRTWPLVEHYREQGLRSIALEVQVDTRPEELAGRLDRALSAL